MITEEQIDWAIRVLENPHALPEIKSVAREMADAYKRQEDHTFLWLCQCYASRRAAHMGQLRYGNRARTR